MKQSDPSAVPITWRIAPVFRLAAKSLQCLPRTCRASRPDARARCARWRRRQPAAKSGTPAGRAKSQFAAAAAAPSGRNGCPTGRSQGRGTTTSAKKPTSAQVNAINSACRSDYPKVCAGVPTGGAPALQCLEKNKSESRPAAGRPSSRRRWRGACGRWASTGGAPASSCRPGGARCGAHGDRAAADAPARGTVRAALGVRRRCSFAVRRRSARRRPHRAVPRHQRGVAVAGVQGHAQSVQGAVTPTRRPRAGGDP